MHSLTIFCAQYLIFGLLLLLAWAWIGQPKSRKQLAIHLISAFIAAVVLAKLADKLYANPRPFIKDHTPSYFAHGNDNGFPSDHSVYAMTITAVLYFYSRQLAAAALVITVLVGWARVAAHVHHGVDVLAGFAIGILGGLLGYWLTRKLTKEKQPATKPAADQE